MVESMCHAMQSVIAHCSVVTTVVNHAAKPALHARKTAATTASIESARRNVVILVILVMKGAPGSAGIINVLNYAGSFAIVRDAMSRAQSYFPAGIPVSVSAGKYARRSVESVTKTNLRGVFWEPKANRT